MIRIDNWWVFLDGIVGTISGHPDQDKFKGTLQWTSAIKGNLENLSELDVVESHSGRVYRLGKPAMGDDERPPLITINLTGHVLIE